MPFSGTRPKLSLVGIKMLHSSTGVVRMHARTLHARSASHYSSCVFPRAKKKKICPKQETRPKSCRKLPGLLRSTASKRTKLGIPPGCRAYSTEYICTYNGTIHLLPYVNAECSVPILLLPRTTAALVASCVLLRTPHVAICSVQHGGGGINVTACSGPCFASPFSRPSGPSAP